MSKKPPKKGDLDKSWLQERRVKTVNILPEYHLIVTEGKKTEPMYFEGLKLEIYTKYGNRGRGRIDIRIEGEGDNTLTLLDRAHKHVDKSSNQIRHVWLVYDKDDFPLDNFDNTAFRCRDLSDENITYHALWSNQCIELWFLLHFGYLQSDLHRTEFKPKIDSYLKLVDKGEYVKNRVDIYEVLRGLLPTAIANAKRLYASFEDKTPSRVAPGTMVYELFEELQPYMQ